MKNQQNVYLIALCLIEFVIIFTILKRMKGQRGFFIREINRTINMSLIDVQMLERYEELAQTSLIQDFHNLFGIKSLKYKQVKIQEMGRFIALATDITHQQVLERLSAFKKTDLTKFMTDILMPDSSSRLSLQNLRKKMIVSLRRKGEASTPDLKLFQMIYSTIYCFGEFDDEMLIDKTKESLNIKTTLISLKKMMGTPCLDKLGRKTKSDSYSINLDVKKIICSIVKSLQGTEQGTKILQLIEGSQNKKWLGPRLYKIISSQGWDASLTKTFIDALRKINIDKEEVRSPCLVVKNVIKKIVINLRKYVKCLGKSKQNVGQKFFEKSQMKAEQKCFNENLFLPDLVQLHQKMPQITRNADYQLEFDLDQFLIKSDEGTIFEKLCQDYNESSLK